MQRTVPRVGTLMGLIEEALRDKFFPALFGGEDITADFRQILGHSVKHGGLGLPDPHLSVENAYNTSKAASRELVESLLGGSILNYVGHRSCIRKASQTSRQTKMSVKLAEVFRRQGQAGGQEKTASIGQQGIGHGLVLYPTALRAWRCIGINSVIIFASDMG